jgi:hypothetical protein
MVTVPFEKYVVPPPEMYPTGATTMRVASEGTEMDCEPEFADCEMVPTEPVLVIAIR